MDVRTKDFLERLGMTLLLAGISFGVVFLTDINEPWALVILAGLQVGKNLIAQQVGDPETSGFTNPLLPDDMDVEIVAGDPDGVPARDPALDGEIPADVVLEEG